MSVIQPSSGPAAVLGDDQPEQPERSLARHLLAVEQHAAEQRLRTMIALVGGEPQPARRLDRILGRALPSQKESAEIVLRLRDRRNRRRRSGTFRARMAGRPSPSSGMPSR